LDTRHDKDINMARDNKNIATHSDAWWLGWKYTKYTGKIYWDMLHPAHAPMFRHVWHDINENQWKMSEDASVKSLHLWLDNLHLEASEWHYLHLFAVVLLVTECQLSMGVDTALLKAVTDSSCPWIGLRVKMPPGLLSITQDLSKSIYTYLYIHHHPSSTWCK
jgi:hypothetical protein